MPKIILPSGDSYKYKTIPLFPGVKQINKEIASDNLLLLKQIFDKYNINFQLAAGTLLGAIRESDFISHDEDIDLALDNTNRKRFLNILPILHNNGFELCRYDRRDLYSIMRSGEYIDLYFFRPYKSGLCICSGWIVKEEHLSNSTKYRFKGEDFLIPQNYEEYLLIEYGKNWRIPAKWNNYNMPKWRIMLFNIKEYAKDYLPNPLFNWLVSKSEKKLIDISIKHLSRIDLDN